MTYDVTLTVRMRVDTEDPSAGVTATSVLRDGRLDWLGEVVSVEMNVRRAEPEWSDPA